MEPTRLLHIDPRQLATLRAVADAGSFRKGAEALGYSQSAVSQQIASLEKVVGDRLLDRSGGSRHVKLTGAGKLLLGHAEAILTRLHAAHADLVAYREGQLEPLRVGVLPSVGAELLPQLLVRFRRAWPRVAVQLRESSIDRELLRLVEQGELDLAFSMLPPVEGPFEVAQVVRDPHVLLLSPDMPQARGRRLPPRHELARLPMIGERHLDAAIVADVRARGLDVEGHLRARGLEPDVVFRSTDNRTVQGLVRAGIGAAIKPLLAVDWFDPGVAVIDAEELVPPRLVGVAWHRDRQLSPVVRAFVDEAVRAGGELEEELAGVLRRNGPVDVSP